MAGRQDANQPNSIRTGARWQSGYVVQGTSQGPDKWIPVRHPYKGPPKRVVSGSGDAKLHGRSLMLRPKGIPEGETFHLVVEF